MMGAPYRFARINRWVHFPEWAGHVSHDVPFEDGYCGTITFDVEAMTPLLVGGPRRRPDGQIGDVWPVRVPSKGYAIPPSSLQGMLRSILQVAAFGKLGGRVEDRRFAVRDLSGTTTSEMLYQERMNIGAATQASPGVPQSQAGWLIRKGNDRQIVRTHIARLHIQQLADQHNTSQPLQDALLAVPRADRRGQIRNSGWNAQERYPAVRFFWPDLSLRVRIEPHDGPHEHSPAERGAPGRRGQPNWIRYFRCSLDANGPTTGTLVLTGKPSGGIIGDKLKKWEFVFHTPDRAGASAALSSSGVNVPEAVWRDFIDIHQPPTGSGRKDNPNWEYWKRDFENGKPVPVFYLEEGGRITAMGTAFMFKAAMPLSTRDLLRHSSEDHFAKSLDLPSLIFGAVEGDHDEMSLKRRASFGFGIANGNPQVEQRRVALSSPKPAFYPNYVRQHPHPGNVIPTSLPYAAYTSYGGATNLGSARVRPELAGTKIFPARGPVQVDQPHYPDAVSTRLHHLPSRTAFHDIPLRIHNLRKVEVGALLWALCFGKAEHLEGMTSPLRHRLGMGKPLGLGEIRIGNVRIALDANDGGQVPDAAGFIQAFVDYMNAHYPGGHWEESVQIKALLKAANPEQVDRALTYHDSYQGYSKARAAGHFLPDYVAGHEIARLGGETNPKPGAGRPPPVRGGGGGGTPGGGHRGGGGPPRRDRGPPPRAAPPRFQPGQRVLIDGQRGTVLMFEDGEYIVEMADGTECSVPPSAITQA